MTIMTICNQLLLAIAYCSLPKRSLEAMIKSAASAASLDLQGCLAVPAVRIMPCCAVARGLPRKSREGALAADFMTAERSLLGRLR